MLLPAVFEIFYERVHIRIDKLCTQGYNELIHKEEGCTDGTDPK
jgi:hypothetical protein